MRSTTLPAAPTDWSGTAALLLASVLGTVVTPIAAQTLIDRPEPQHVDLQLGTELASGRYGGTTLSRDLQHTLTLRHRRGDWIWSIDLPWIRSKTSASEGVQATQVEGLGDAWLKVTHPLLDASPEHSVSVDWTLKLKTQTGATRLGLGSGSTDFALQVEASQPMGSGLMWFGLLGHRLTGDASDGPQRRNPWYAELGAQHSSTSGMDVGTYLHARQPIGPLGGTREWTAYSAWRFDRSRLQLYLTRGYAQASPDWAGGLVMRQRF